MANMNMTRRFRSALTCLILTAVVVGGSFNAALASGLDASVSTTKLALGDSLTLRLSNDGGDRSPPDLSPLQKDFEVLGSSQSSQTTIINGARTDSFAWLINLSPKAKGKISIPSLRAGQMTSDPLSIEVLDAAAMPAGPSSEAGLSIDVSIEPGSHYVHEEIPLTVTITQGAGARDLQLSELASNDFGLKQNGEDKIYRGKRNGATVNVIERRYLLQPQKSGSLTVPPLTLRARVNDPDARRSPFGGAFAGGAFGGMFNSPGMSSSIFDDIFNPGRPVAVSSQPLVLDIKARPGTDGGWFLPARDVQLQSDWGSASPTFKVGEAATRTIRLLALGASQEQLPDIRLDSATGARVYVDRSHSDTIDSESGIVAVREFVTSVVPTGAAQITLPAIEVKWWDTEADVERVASLPEETYPVQGGTVPAAGSNADEIAANTVTAGTDQGAPVGIADSAQGSWTWIAAGAGAALVLLLAWRLLIARGNRRPPSTPGSAAVRRQPHAKPPLSDQETQLATALKAVEAACKQNDRATAYTACCAWLKLRFGANALTPSKLREVSPQLAEEFAAMERALYAGDKQAGWTGNSLWQAIASVKRRGPGSAGHRSRTEILPPLYPARSGH
jgi:hypothetical protein